MSRGFRLRADLAQQFYPDVVYERRPRPNYWYPSTLRIPTRIPKPEFTAVPPARYRGRKRFRKIPGFGFEICSTEDAPLFKLRNCTIHNLGMHTVCMQTWVHHPPSLFTPSTTCICGQLLVKLLKLTEKKSAGNTPDTIVAKFNFWVDPLYPH